MILLVSLIDRKLPGWNTGVTDWKDAEKAINQAKKKELEKRKIAWIQASPQQQLTMENPFKERRERRNHET